MPDRFDVAVIGAGLAGLTAATYAARFGLKTVVLERLMSGGQVINVEKLENFPGFPQGVSGAELGPLTQEQATGAGAEFQLTEVSGLQVQEPYRVVETADGALEAKAVIVAAGSALRKLGVPGEEELLGRGVSQCASCDAAFFVDQVVGVVGGGDSALDEALVLTDYASQILIFHRRDQFRAQNIAQERILDHPKIEVRWNTEVEAILGEETVSGVRIKDLTTGNTNEEPVEGMFIFVGLEPNTRFLQGVVPLDNAGHIPVSLWMETEVPGIFAAGDLRQHSASQLVSAAGDGATAAVAAARYISGKSWG